MKFVTYFKTSLFVKIAISIILISLISQSLAAEASTAENSTLRTMKRVHSTRFAEENSTLRTMKRFIPDFKKIEEREKRQNEKLKKQAKAAWAKKYPVCKYRGYLTGVPGLPIDWSGAFFKAWILKQKMPTNNKTLKDVWQNGVKPLIKILPTNAVPNLIVGDFNTKYLSKSVAASNSKCSEFPIAENEQANMSVIGFSMGALPCPEPLNAAICVIFDKCGTYGISISGGTLACLATLVSGGTAVTLSPFIEGIGHLQAGYSSNRSWEQKITLMNIKSDKEIKAMAKKSLKYTELLDTPLRSHVYVGAQVEFPDTGIKVGDKDIADIFALKINGKWMVDFGTINEFSQQHFKRIVNDKRLSPSVKFFKFASAAVEYSAVAKGTFELKWADLTKQVVPDMKLADLGELHVLVNTGEEKRGDMGSSGMAPGLHIYFKPSDIGPFLLHFKQVYNIITLVLKMSNLDVEIPKLPKVDTAIGISLEKESIRFKLNVIKGKKSLFSLKCVMDTKSSSDFDLDCDINGYLVEMIKKGAKIIVKYVHRGLAHFNKYVKKFGVAVKDKAVEIYGKMKKKAVTIFKKAKLLAQNLATKAKVAIRKFEKEVKKVGNKLKKTLKYIGKWIQRGGAQLAHYFKQMAKQMEEAVKKLGTQIKDLAKTVYRKFKNAWNYLFNHDKYLRDQKAYIEKQKAAIEFKKNIIKKVKFQVELADLENKIAKEKKILKTSTKEQKRNRRYLEEEL